MVEKFMVEKFMVEKFMVETIIVEKSMVEMSINPTKRVRCLMLPFLVIIGLSQLLIMGSILACVVYLPLEAKLLAIAVTAAEAFIIFPWWYAVIHLFAVFEKDQFNGSYLVYPAPSMHTG